MGTRYSFTCESCGYKAEVSGGEDCGITSATATVLCEGCLELYDVEISEDAMTRRPERERPIRCPKSRLHRLRLWRHPGPCPRCRRLMTRGQETVVWD